MKGGNDIKNNSNLLVPNQTLKSNIKENYNSNQAIINLKDKQLNTIKSIDNSLKKNNDTLKDNNSSINKGSTYVYDNPIILTKQLIETKTRIDSPTKKNNDIIKENYLSANKSSTNDNSIILQKQSSEKIKNSESLTKKIDITVTSLNTTKLFSTPSTTFYNNQNTNSIDKVHLSSIGLSNLGNTCFM